MGIFVDRVAGEGNNNDTTVFHTGRVVFSVAVAGLLIVAAILVSILADNFATEQALNAAANSAYKAATSVLPAVATSIMILAAAWSAALVGILVGEKAK